MIPLSSFLVLYSLSSTVRGASQLAVRSLPCSRPLAQALPSVNHILIHLICLLPASLLSVHSSTSASTRQLLSGEFLVGRLSSIDRKVSQLTPLTHLSLNRATNPSLREQATLAMLRGQTYGPSPQAAMIKRPGMGKVLLKGAAGVGAIAALFIGLGAYAHPSLPNTTPDNEYGLVPTAFCDVYGEPIMRDFRGVLWNKSTYARLDLKNPPPLHYCSDQELADAGYAAQGGGSAQAGGPTPMQKRSSQERTTVSSDQASLFCGYTCA